MCSYASKYLKMDNLVEMLCSPASLILYMENHIMCSYVVASYSYTTTNVSLSTLILNSGDWQGHLYGFPKMHLNK